MIMAPRAMAYGSTPSWLQNVASSEAIVALIRWGEIFLERDERPPAVVLIGDLLQQHAVAVEDAGRLERVGGDVGRVRQTAVDLLVLIDRRGDRGRRRKGAGDDRHREEEEDRDGQSSQDTNDFAGIGPAARDSWQEMRWQRPASRPNRPPSTRRTRCG